MTSIRLSLSLSRHAHRPTRENRSLTGFLNQQLRLLDCAQSEWNVGRMLDGKGIHESETLTGSNKGF